VIGRSEQLNLNWYLPPNEFFLSDPWHPRIGGLPAKCGRAVPLGKPNSCAGTHKRPHDKPDVSIDLTLQGYCRQYHVPSCRVRLFSELCSGPSVEVRDSVTALIPRNILGKIVRSYGIE